MNCGAKLIKIENHVKIFNFSGGKYSSLINANQIDDEHKLIARYAARLAAEVAAVVIIIDFPFNFTFLFSFNVVLSVSNFVHWSLGTNYVRGFSQFGHIKSTKRIDFPIGKQKQRNNERNFSVKVILDYWYSHMQTILLLILKIFNSRTTYECHVVFGSPSLYYFYISIRKVGEHENAPKEVLGSFLQEINVG